MALSYLDSMSETDEITQLLNSHAGTNGDIPGRLLELVYNDLRRLAANYMRNERRGHTLQATALVHEAFVRLVDWKNVSWENRAQFFAVAAQVMRKVLVDHARQRGAVKRGGDAVRMELNEAVEMPDRRDVGLLDLEQVLAELEKIDPRQAKIVELRFFGGLSIPETAHVLGLSETTIKREWTFAKAWFQRELG